MSKAATKRAKARDGIEDLQAFARERDFGKMAWEKVRAPMAWVPEIGEALLGYYQGREPRNGTYGPYEVLQVAVPRQGIVFISGTGILQLASNALLEPGDPVKIIYRGLQALENGHNKKLFELYVARAARK